MNKYENSKIYKICSDFGDDMYVGSTTNQLSKRMATHRSDYRQWKQGKKGKCSSYDIFDKYGVDNCKIILVEECKCNNKNQLRKKEDEYIRNMDCINKNKAFITDEEKKQYKQQYYEDNKHNILEQVKQNYEQNKDNKLQQMKQYYEQNKEKLLEQMKQPKHCDDCNCEIRKSDFKKHERSKKHINNLNKKK